ALTRTCPIDQRVGANLNPASSVLCNTINPYWTAQNGRTETIGERLAMKIAELERVSGVGRSTLHHYLNLGLLPPPERLGPKLHLYGPAHIEGLRQIRRLQRRGLSLTQMKARLSPLADSPSESETTRSRERFLRRG